jgi:hypothetical protein
MTPIRDLEYSAMPHGGPDMPSPEMPPALGVAGIARGSAIAPAGYAFRLLRPECSGPAATGDGGTKIHPLANDAGESTVEFKSAPML